LPVLTQIELCNRALDEIPAAQIITITEKSVQADVCRRHYPAVVGELLEKGNWSDARAQAPLAALADNDRAPIWAVAYAAPSDMVMPVRLLPAYSPSSDPDSFLLPGQRLASPMSATDDPGLDFDIAGNTIYANTSGAVLEYVRLGPIGGGSMSHLFARAVVMELAARISMPIRKDTGIKRQLMAEAKLALDEALASNANRRPQTYGDFVPDAVAAMWGGPE
jgi:hypothetical protein